MMERKSIGTKRVCPECGVPMLGSNLARHMRTVHQAGKHVSWDTEINTGLKLILKRSRDGSPMLGQPSGQVPMEGVQMCEGSPVPEKGIPVPEEGDQVLKRGVQMCDGAQVPVRGAQVSGGAQVCGGAKVPTGGVQMYGGAQVPVRGAQVSGGAQVPTGGVQMYGGAQVSKRGAQEVCEDGQTSSDGVQLPSGGAEQVKQEDTFTEKVFKGQGFRNYDPHGSPVSTSTGYSIRSEGSTKARLFQGQKSGDIDVDMSDNEYTWRLKELYNTSKRGQIAGLTLEEVDMLTNIVRKPTKCAGIKELFAVHGLKIISQQEYATYVSKEATQPPPFVVMSKMNNEQHEVFVSASGVWGIKIVPTLMM